MGHLIDQYLLRKKRLWIIYYEEKKARKGMNVALGLMDTVIEPRLLELPNRQEMRAMIKDYAASKFML